MKKFYDYSLTWKLLLVPVVATVCFTAYLVYSSLVLSDGNALLKEVRDVNFPALEAAGKVLQESRAVVEALNSSAATGELEFLGVASAKAAEIQGRYDALKRLDPQHLDELEQLKVAFDAFFTQAYAVAEKMATKSMPAPAQILEMRHARDAYLSAANAYRDGAEQGFHATVARTLTRSEQAQKWGALIGTLMVAVVALLTLLVTRGIVALERGVAERNKRLAEVNDELEQEIRKLKAAEEAKSHAEAASQFKDEFLANMSHELRTPMNAIIGLSHLCMHTDMSGRQRDYVQKIHDSGKSLLGILNDILDVSKIEAGKLELERSLFDLDGVMDNLSTIIGNQSGQKNLEFLMDIARDVPLMLVGDALRLGQVLINLAGNAVKFTEQGEVVVRVVLESEIGDQVTLRFIISDTGIGMSQKEIERLFQPFTQADSSITRKFGGTGLGLTISRRLVEMMGGKIGVESTPGAGSQFSFTAKFKKAEKQGSDRSVNEMRGMRVLAVDDSDSSLQIMKHYLESFSFSVTLAQNGHDALAMVERAEAEGHPFELAVVDWKMPEMDGLELSKNIRLINGLRFNPKILLVSSQGHNEMAHYVADGMVDGMLSKPLQPSKLFDAIVRLHRQSGAASGKFRIAAQFDRELVAKIRGAKLLLVEDNKINQQVALELLDNIGITASIAENGQEAIDLLKQMPFDGVLMDMQMPVMDGVTATREIRKNPKFASLPIIALTANVMISKQHEFLDAGMNDHVGKPIDPDHLLATLARWVRPAAASAASATQKGIAQEMLPELPGIDVAASVQRVGGKVAVFYSLLDRFRSDERNAVGRIRDALALNDRQSAARAAHTLRGVAGTLGAQALQQQAGALEDCIQHHDDPEQALELVARELAEVIGNIDRAFEQRGA